MNKCTCFPQLCKTWSHSSCCCLFSRLAFPYPAWVNCCSTWIKLFPMIHRHLSRTSWTSVRVFCRYSAFERFSDFKILMIYLILHLLCNRLHGPPGWGAAWARCHWGAHFSCITEFLSSSTQRSVTLSSKWMSLCNFYIITFHTEISGSTKCFLASIFDF